MTGGFIADTSVAIGWGHPLRKAARQRGIQPSSV